MWPWLTSWRRPSTRGSRTSSAITSGVSSLDVSSMISTRTSTPGWSSTLWTQARRNLA
jgi:hypothetical protein